MKTGNILGIILFLSIILMWINPVIGFIEAVLLLIIISICLVKI